MPKIVKYLRSDVVPLVLDPESPLEISDIDVSRICKLMGESIWQMGLPIVSLKPAPQKLSSYQNPFSKALSSLTATESVTGSTYFQTNQSKHSFDLSDSGESQEKTKKPKPMKTLSLKPKTFNIKP